MKHAAIIHVEKKTWYITYISIDPSELNAMQGINRAQL